MNLPEDHYVIIISSDNKLVVAIKMDGDVIYGEGFTKQEAAKEFWKMVARQQTEAIQCPGTQSFMRSVS